MFHVKHPQEETISAIATPLGVGGVGIIRISGEKAREIFSRLFVPSQQSLGSNGTTIKSHKMLHGWATNPKTNEKVDEALACFMQAPKSYTGEDVAEFYCHGGMAVVQSILSLTIEAGARLAQRGEFAKRAYLNGKIDLTQAEAVLDLVNAQTAAGAGFAVRQLEGRLSKIVSEIRQRIISSLAELETLIDFPDDLPELDYKAFLSKLQHHIKEVDGLLVEADAGKIYREGLATVILGKPNVGKSSLLNALLGEERAIVTEEPGTTRDAIVETINISGLPLRVSDTAGIHQPRNKAEELGVERADKELGGADFVLLVIDASEVLDNLDNQVVSMAKGKKGLVVLNKIDLGIKTNKEGIRRVTNGLPSYEISALYGQGLQELKKGIFDYIQSQIRLPAKDAVTINSRHKDCLTRAKEGLVKAAEDCGKNLPADFITISLKSAIVALGEVTGELVSDEVIKAIFDKFCVGK